MLFIQLLPLLLFLSHAVARIVTEVRLDYGTFAGGYDSTNHISYWNKIPFAAPPVGENRFRAPQPPTPILNGTYNSTNTYPRCPQLAVNGSEDCLYLGVYSRPWTKGQPLRPVYVEFFSGGFKTGGGSSSPPGLFYASLNVSKENDFIAVGPNYRLNTFGFLPGKEIGDDAKSDLNPG